MKVVSWNIAGGHIFTGKIADASSYEEENLEYFIDILRERNADIVLLQESHTPIKGGEKSQGTLIAEELGY
ncbi:MAG: endonuclease/exonuclease/phosphatase family protein, partial [bacterium]|nr:endonuclease/exonuclease/phosphatase family protein [bacterium]